MRVWRGVLCVNERCSDTTGAYESALSGMLERTARARGRPSGALWVCGLCVVCTEHQPNPRSEWGSGILERMQSAVVGERVPTCGEPEPAGTHCSCERLAENQSDPSQDLAMAMTMPPLGLEAAAPRLGSLSSTRCRFGTHPTDRERERDTCKMPLTLGAHINATIKVGVNVVQMRGRWSEWGCARMPLWVGVRVNATVRDVGVPLNATILCKGAVSPGG